MSLSALCPGCESGHHDRHIADWNIRPGVIGGASCYCEGDPGCTERANAAVKRLSAHMFPERFVVEKQSYSRGAWRVLHADGRQVFRDATFDHPFLGPMRIAGPVCFDRKRDALAWVTKEQQR